MCMQLHKFSFEVGECFSYNTEGYFFMFLTVKLHTDIATAYLQWSTLAVDTQQ